jgi:hypothetical protein
MILEGKFFVARIGDGTAKMAEWLLPFMGQKQNT